MTSQLVLLKYQESESLDMKSNYSLFLKAAIPNQHHFNSKSDQLTMMTTQQVNSFLRIENKMHTASFLRCRGVL